MLIYDFTNSEIFSVKGTQQNFSLLQATSFQYAFQRDIRFRNVLAPRLLKEGKNTLLKPIKGFSEERS